MRQVCMWGHVALRQGMCRVTCGLRSLASSDALRGHVTRGPGGFLSTWGVGVAPPYSKKGSSRSLTGGSPLTRS